jgi:hypothetical protein
MIVENSDKNSSRCQCPGCPTHDDCMKKDDERLYCSRGQTDCDPSGHGCLCSDCPVWAENRLGGRYFCIEGVAR